jgi:Methyltransferase domain
VPPRTTAWTRDDVLEIDGVGFVSRPMVGQFSSASDRFCVAKRRALISAYLDLLDERRPVRIMELGVFQGGSCALMALVADPELLITVDHKNERVPALDTFIAERGLGDHVHVHYGVDQADAVALRRIVDEHCGSGGLDMIVDDASHLVGPSRVSFNTLFPCLRPGGVYIIEDWSWAHVGFGVALPDEIPLTQLVFEVTMALPSRPGLIAELRIDRDWAMVVRGDAALEAGDFDISECNSERGRALLASPR